MGTSAEPLDVFEASFQGAAEPNAGRRSLTFDLHHEDGGRIVHASLERGHGSALEGSQAAAGAVGGLEEDLVAGGDLAVPRCTVQLPDGALGRRSSGLDSQTRETPRQLLGGLAGHRYEAVHQQLRLRLAGDCLKRDARPVPQRLARGSSGVGDREALPVALVLPPRPQLRTLHVDVAVGLLGAQEGDAAREHDGWALCADWLPLRRDEHPTLGDLVAQRQLGASQADGELRLDGHRAWAPRRNGRWPPRLGVAAGVTPESHVLLQVSAVVVVRDGPPEIRLQRRRQQLLATGGQPHEHARGSVDGGDSAARDNAEGGAAGVVDGGLRGLRPRRR
mmetsp:Transcript_36686/g.105481  ORF Transcript_36686/g.105481 Transcript_36686/m.105481 type:complete len:335 (+) Transcript_36686:599-1603(+)